MDTESEYVVQAFVPYDSFVFSAKALDWRRLGKQRLECKQILNILSGENPSSSWRNHPAVKMWDGYDISFCFYALAMCTEWKRRGYKDTLTEHFQDYLVKHKYERIVLPYWWGDDRIHSSHRQTLLYKDPEWYGQFGWTEEPKYEYYWAGKAKNEPEYVQL